MDFTIWTVSANLKSGSRVRTWIQEIARCQNDSKSGRNETRLLPLPPSFFASVRLLSLSVRRSHKEIQPLLLSSQRKQVRPRPRFLRSDSLVLITANGQLGLQETTLPVVPDPTRLRSSSVRPGVQCGGRGRRNWDKIKDMCVMRACPSASVLPPSLQLSAASRASFFLRQRESECCLPTERADEAFTANVTDLLPL